MYDITNPVSFKNLSTWKQNFLDKAMPKDCANFPFFLIGNKKDLEKHRQTSSATVEAWAKKNNEMPYEECSALDGTNIEKAFLKMAEDLLDASTKGLLNNAE